MQQASCYIKEYIVNNDLINGGFSLEEIIECFIEDDQVNKNDNW